MFSLKIPPEESIPILNKPPVNPPSSSAADESTKNYINEFFAQNRSRTSKKSAKPKKFIPPDSYDSHVQFKVYEHFCISKKSIRQLCGNSTGCDIHIVFYDDMPSLPQIGVSCFSYEELWKEQVELQGIKTTLEKLDFIEIIPYKNGCPDVRPFDFTNIAPRENQVLTISLDTSDDEGVKLRFWFGSEFSCWIWVNYPPLISDYSLVLGIKEKNLLKRIAPLQIMTTYGLLCLEVKEPFIRQGAQQNNQKGQEPSVSEGKVKGTEVEESECNICWEPGSDVLFFPCSHCVVHMKCLNKNYGHLLSELEAGKCIADTRTVTWNKIGQATAQENKSKERLTCFKCKQLCQQVVPLRIVGQYCYFCNEDKQCQLFDSYYYPCGCSLGCIEGFKRNINELKMGRLNCLNCGRIIENIQPFYRA